MLDQTDVEIISIGNELLNGRTVNTNLTLICKKLTISGINVLRAYTVKDELKEIVDVLRFVLEQKMSSWIITSGGLGPTHDDITLQGVAQALRRKISINEKALEMIRGRNANLILTDARRKMALFPEGAMPLNNPIGMAPAAYLRELETNIICLPGVPQELEAITDESVLPMIKKDAGEFFFIEGILWVQGLREADLAPIISEVFRERPQVYIKSHPKGEESGIELSLTVTTRHPDNSRELVRKSLEEISSRVLQARGSISSSRLVNQK